MRDTIRVLVLGTGQVGCGIARLVLRKQGPELVGAYARRAARSGLDLGQGVGLGWELNIRIGVALDASLVLHSMADLPVPAAILGDARQLGGAPAWLS